LLFSSNFTGHYYQPQKKSIHRGSTCRGPFGGILAIRLQTAGTATMGKLDVQYLDIWGIRSIPEGHTQGGQVVEKGKREESLACWPYISGSLQVLR
jgi:hypothetical protein